MRAQDVADFIIFPVINEACRVVEEVRFSIPHVLNSLLNIPSLC